MSTNSVSNSSQSDKTQYKHNLIELAAQRQEEADRYDANGRLELLRGNPHGAKAYFDAADAAHGESLKLTAHAKSIKDESPSSEGDDNPRCPHCHQEMSPDGVQRYPELGYKWNLYTCETKGCPRRGFTYSFNKRGLEVM